MTDWSEVAERMTAMPLFGVRSFTPLTSCHVIHPGRTDPKTGERTGKIPAGHLVCCMVCHASGIDGHPGLEITPKDESDIKAWKPEEGMDAWSEPEEVRPDAPEPTVYRGPHAPVPETPTRKQRRAARKPS